MKSHKRINGVAIEMKYGIKYSIGDVIEQWYIDGEGGNSDVQYSEYCATRDAAKTALKNSDFPGCPLGDGGLKFSGSRVGFAVTSPRPYHLIGERLTVTGLGQHGQIQSYTRDLIECVRIVDGVMTDKSGMVAIN